MSELDRKMSVSRSANFIHKLTITLEGGHGKSAKLKDFVAAKGIFARSQAGHSIVDSSPGINVSIVYGM